MAFTDFLKLQDDGAHLLLSDGRLSSVNVVTREKLILDNSRLPDQTLAAEVLAYLTERNGRKGAGVIVEKPEFSVSLPNVPGPQGDITLTFLVLEDPLENEAPDSGTLMPADQIAQCILDLGHLWALEGIGIFAAAADAMRAAKDFEPLRGYRVKLRSTSNRGQTQRICRVSITSAGDPLLVTLATATAEADIWYVVGDGSPAPSNPAATKYADPFEAVAGSVVRAAAFAVAGSASAGMLQSSVARKTV